MILVVDSGSTKTDWISVDDNGDELFSTQTLGLNPQVLSSAILKERIINIDNSANDAEYKQLGNLWLQKAINYKYALNFDWLGIPIIQLPTDIYAIQELIWNIKHPWVTQMIK